MSDNLTNKIPFFFMADSIIFLSFGIILILTWPIIEVDLSFFGVFFGTFLLVNLRHHSFSLIWSISFYFLFNGIIMLITSLRDNDSYKPDENSSAAAP